MRKLLLLSFPHIQRTFSLAIKNEILVSEENGVRRIVLNNVKTRNALSMDLMGELLREIENTSDISHRCIVLAANGPVFSSGHNLKELAADDSSAHEKTFARCGALCLAIAASPVPVIAAVDGVAAAAGCQLVAASDIVVATENSQFSTPGANFGLFCSAPGVAIGRSMGRKAAARMVLTGLPLSAQEALEAGLISYVCPKGQLDEAVKLHTDAIINKSRQVIELGKRFFGKQLEMGLSPAYIEAANVMTNNLKLPDGQEGLKSFVEKRKAVWSHADKNE